MNGPLRKRDEKKKACDQKRRQPFPRISPEDRAFKTFACFGLAPDSLRRQVDRPAGGRVLRPDIF
jgi:hypothetical protein